LKHQKGRERAVHDEVTLAMCVRERERENAAVGVGVGEHIKKLEVSPVSVSFANIRNHLAIVLLYRSLPF
jgi:hypothetical protein